MREALFGSVEELFLYYHYSTVIFYLGSMDEIINFDDFISMRHSHFIYRDDHYFHVIF